jgi:hypothetical protein
MNKIFFISIISLFILVNSLLSLSAYSKSLEIDNYLLEYNYDNPTAGNTFSLNVNLTNLKNSPVNLTLELDDSSPFDISGQKEWATNFSANEEKTNRFVIEVDDDAENKRYDLEFNLDDEQDDWDNYFLVRVVSDSAELNLGEITSIPKKITPGLNEVELKINIKNSGEYDAEDLIVKLELPEGFIASSSYSTIAHIGDLDSGDSKIVSFYFDVEEKLDNLEAQAVLILEYNTDGEEEIQKLDVNIPVFAIPQFEILSLEKLTGEIYPGTKSKIKIAIKNTAQEKANDVSLRVYERSDQPFEFVEKSSYIGSLNSNEVGYAVFEFETTNKAAPLKYVLDFQVRAVDGENVIVKDLSSSMEVKKKEFNLTNYLGYILLGIIVLVIGIFYLKKRRH